MACILVGEHPSDPLARQQRRFNRKLCKRRLSPLQAAKMSRCAIFGADVHRVKRHKPEPPPSLDWLRGHLGRKAEQRAAAVTAKPCASVTDISQDIREAAHLMHAAHREVCKVLAGVDGLPGIAGHMAKHYALAREMTGKQLVKLMKKLGLGRSEQTAAGVALSISKIVAKSPKDAKLVLGILFHPAGLASGFRGHRAVWQNIMAVAMAHDKKRAITERARTVESFLKEASFAQQNSLPLSLLYEVIPKVPFHANQTPSRGIPALLTLETPDVFLRSSAVRGDGAGGYALVVDTSNAKGAVDVSRDRDIIAARGPPIFDQPWCWGEDMQRLLPSDGAAAACAETVTKSVSDERELVLRGPGTCEHVPGSRTWATDRHVAARWPFVSVSSQMFDEGRPEAAPVMCVTTLVTHRLHGACARRVLTSRGLLPDVLSLMVEDYLGCIGAHAKDRRGAKRAGGRSKARG